MIAENTDRPPGRTRDELELAAMGVRVREAIREYRRKSNPPDTFSYSLETRQFYEANDPEGRTSLLENYGDGHSSLYMVAVTNVRGLITDGHAIRVAEKYAQQGRVPFIGRWVQNGKLHEDVSIALDHGISPAVVHDMLIEHGQEAALVIERGGFTFMYANSA